MTNKKYISNDNGKKLHHTYNVTNENPRPQASEMYNSFDLESNILYSKSDVLHNTIDVNYTIFELPYFKYSYTSNSGIKTPIGYIHPTTLNGLNPIDYINSICNNMAIITNAHTNEEFFKSIEAITKRDSDIVNIENIFNIKVSTALEKFEMNIAENIKQNHEMYKLITEHKAFKVLQRNRKNQFDVTQFTCSAYHNSITLHCGYDIFLEFVHIDKGVSPQFTLKHSTTLTRQEQEQYTHDIALTISKFVKVLVDIYSDVKHRGMMFNILNKSISRHNFNNILSNVLVPYYVEYLKHMGNRFEFIRINDKSLGCCKVITVDLMSNIGRIGKYLYDYDKQSKSTKHKIKSYDPILSNKNSIHYTKEQKLYAVAYEMIKHGFILDEFDNNFTFSSQSNIPTGNTLPKNFKAKFTRK